MNDKKLKALRNKRLDINPRATTQNDTRAISELLQNVFADTYGASLDKETLKHHLQTHLAENIIQKDIQTATYFLVEKDQKLLGVLKLIEDEGKAEIDKLYVWPDSTGQGVGSRLMQTAIAWSKDNEAKSLWLKVWKENKQAIRFYQKHGFQKAAHTNVYVGDVVFDDLVMEKYL